MVTPGPRFAWSRQEVDRITPAGVECLAVAARRETVGAGLRVLEEGGNAVDAAVCMAFVAAVVEPTEASIGGSGFMLLHDQPGGTTWSVEFPPRAPVRSHAEMYDPIPEAPDPRFLGTVAVRGDANATGPRACCVPGVVAGLCLAAERFGTLPLTRLLEPAIEVAEAGFEIDEYFTLQALAHLEPLRASPETNRAFLTGGLPAVAPFAADADPPVLRQPELAETLRAIAAYGPDGFYRGRVGRAIARAFRERGGLISEEDLDRYQAVVGTALERRYRGWWVLCPRAPCGGWTVLQALGILEHFPLGELGPVTATRFHVMAEALHAAFADRYRFAGDMEPDCSALEPLLSEAHAAACADSIRHDRAMTRGLPHSASAADTGHGTTHLNVIDADGRVVSCTITAGNTFGSKFMAAGTGVLFDSGMAWFDPRPGTRNSIAPAKRPLVNMSPLLVLKDGRARMAVGAAGGRRIISAVTQVVTAVIDHGLAMQDAISAPRLDASDPEVRVSDRLPDTILRDLRGKGHDVLAVAEEHAPFSYELARPAAAGMDEHGVLSGGIHPYSRGYVAGR